MLKAIEYYSLCLIKTINKILGMHVLVTAKNVYFVEEYYFLSQPFRVHNITLLPYDEPGVNKMLHALLFLFRTQNSPKSN